MSCHSIYFEIALSDLDDGEGGGGGVVVVVAGEGGV